MDTSASVSSKAHPLVPTLLDVREGDQLEVKVLTVVVRRRPSDGSSEDLITTIEATQELPNVITAFREARDRDSFVKACDVLEEGLLQGSNAVLSKALSQAASGLCNTLIPAEDESSETKKRIRTPYRLVKLDSQFGSDDCLLPHRITRYLNSKEHLRTCRLQMFMHLCATDVSYGKGHELINYLLAREASSSKLALSTYGDAERKTGAQLEAAVSNATAKALAKYGFDPDTGVLVKPERFTPTFELLSNVKEPLIIEGVLDSLFAAENQEVDLNLCKAISNEQGPSVNICTDGVLSKQQKEQRLTAARAAAGESVPVKEGTQYNDVNNATVLVSGFQPAYFTGRTPQQVLLQVLAFLLENNLIFSHRLIFFTDGASNLKVAIERIFGFIKYKHFLDWHHVNKRCAQLISQAVTGTIQEKKMLLKRICAFLWFGNTDAPIKLCEAIRTQDKAQVLSLLHPKYQPQPDAQPQPERAPATWWRKLMTCWSPNARSTMA